MKDLTVIMKDYMMEIIIHKELTKESPSIEQCLNKFEIGKEVVIYADGAKYFNSGLRNLLFGIYKKTQKKIKIMVEEDTMREMYDLLGMGKYCELFPKYKESKFDFEKEYRNRFAFS